MNPSSQNRLTVVGPRKDIARFNQEPIIDARPGWSDLDLLEISATRMAWQFRAPAPPLGFLKQSSLQWPALTFLLDYDREGRRIKGLAKVKRGKLRHYRVKY